MKKYRRKRKLPKPRLQMRLIGWFVAVSLIGLLLEALLLASSLTELTSRLPSGGAAIHDELTSMLAGTMVASVLIVCPLTVLVGVLATFRLAGPIHRFEQHLSALARGEDPGPCRLRRGDELQELCVRLNDAVEALRREGRSPQSDERRSAAA